jgi:hypothetical protein
MTTATLSGPNRWLPALLLTLLAPIANSIEEPKFELLLDIDGIEIRRYVPTIQAVTAMPGYSSGGFRRLAGYIFGGNENEQSIAMTAPVQETMSGSDGEMAFTLPSEYAIDDLPNPDSDNVELRPVPERLVAVIVFSGRASDKKAEEKWQELSAKLNANNIEITGEPLLNQYNPPWTLPFLRRNEVMVEINEESLPAVATGK